MNLKGLYRILAAREERVERQKRLLSSGGILVSYTLNIPGPVKTAVLYRYVFETGLRRLKEALNLYDALWETGCNEAGFYALAHISSESGRTAEETAACPASEGEYPAEKFSGTAVSVSETAAAVKALTVELEEEQELGRLFDMDVLYAGPDGEPAKISRIQLGKPGRNCLVCDAPAFVCVRAARHSAAEVLMRVIDRILASAEIREKIGNGDDFDPLIREALRALLYEVITTPKPGLVDTENEGAHTDMDITLFFDSALTLVPYFSACLQTGTDNAGRDPEELLMLLRPLGRDAECSMYDATGGVNTHKGMIFTFGILCCAAGWLRGNGDSSEPDEAERILRLAGRICARMENGNPILRREVMNGYPSVRRVLRETSGSRKSCGNGDGVRMLVMLLAYAEDANVVRRNGAEAGTRLKARAAQLLKKFPERTESETEEKGEKGINSENSFLAAVAELDRELIRENSSPGGAADLLAVCYFLRFLAKTGEP